MERRSAAASSSAWWMTGTTHSTCLRAASSGITPPERSKALLDDAMTLLKTAVPSSTMAADVSSQEVSRARMRMEGDSTEKLLIMKQMGEYC